MMNVTLRQLRYFAETARQRHFGRAAEVCGVSQPALSLQIKQLEETLGGALLERQGGQVMLTDMGEALLRRAEGILKDVEELGDFARAAQDTFAGRLRIGMIPTVAPYMLPGMMAQLKAAYPAVELYVRESPTKNLLEDLKGGRLDVAVVALPVSEPSLTEVPLFEEPFLLVRPAADRKKPKPTGDELRRMNLLLLEEGHCFREQALAFCKIPAAGAGGVEAGSLGTLVQMVAAGLGITLIPAMAAAELGRANVDIVRLPTPRPSRTVGLVWRKGSPLAGQFLQVVALMKDMG